MFSFSPVSLVCYGFVGTTGLNCRLIVVSCVIKLLCFFIDVFIFHGVVKVIFYLATIASAIKHSTNIKI